MKKTFVFVNVSVAGTETVVNGRKMINDTKRTIGNASIFYIFI